MFLLDQHVVVLVVTESILFRVLYLAFDNKIMTDFILMRWRGYWAR